MKKINSQILANEIHSHAIPKKTLQTMLKIPGLTYSILALGLIIILALGWIAISSVQAATLATDPVTLVNTTLTSGFNTPNDPRDDSIEYTPNPTYTGPDSFEYQICDGAAACVKALVSITVNPVTLVATVNSPQILSADEINAPFPQPDNATTLVDTWVNIDVLANDSFGASGPGTGPIRVSSDCTPLCSGPSNGTVRVSDGPRSPDPSGLAYLRDHPIADYRNKLLISDAEVNEIKPLNEAAFSGVNLFLTDLLGAVTPTLDGTGRYYRLTTVKTPLPDKDFSDEPTDVAYNPANGFLYFSDDTTPRGVYELDPGPDKFYSTSDDVVTSFNLGILADPEGVTFDTWRGRVLIVDGTSEDVYDIDLGLNGVLDPTDTVTTFNVFSIGIVNPEGIAFNPDNGNLYILSRSFDLIAETTITGKLLRYLDLSPINPKHPSGLDYAPASGDPSKNNLYILDRGVDNDLDPLENDGKMYEVSFEPNVPPGVDAGPDQLISFLGSATLNGTVVEDGLPNPPGTYATLWSQFSGPGLATFTDATLEDTTATFSTVGVYVLRLEADDSDRTAFDDITITVSPETNLPPTVVAGPAQTIILPNSATLDGTVTDDGLPAPPTLTYSWSIVSGPGAVTFGDATAVDTTASFAVAGDYILRLTAFDIALSAFGDIAIKVKPAFNQAPSVDAGPPQTITLPNSASLNGTVMDDGLPNPPASTTTIWRKISGTGTVNFATASAVKTSASFSAAGVYVLRLSANDSELSNHDEVTITVQESEVQMIWLPVVFKNQ